MIEIKSLEDLKWEDDFHPGRGVWCDGCNLDSNLQLRSKGIPGGGECVGKARGKNFLNLLVVLEIHGYV